MSFSKISLLDNEYNEDTTPTIRNIEQSLKLVAGKAKTGMVH